MIISWMVFVKDGSDGPVRASGLGDSPLAALVDAHVRLVAAEEQASNDVVALEASLDLVVNAMEEQS